MRDMLITGTRMPVTGCVHGLTFTRDDEHGICPRIPKTIRPRLIIRRRARVKCPAWTGRMVPASDACFLTGCGYFSNADCAPGLQTS